MSVQHDIVTGTLLIIVCVFAGALVRSTFGFGEAVVTMPLLALLAVGIDTATPLVGLVGVTVAFIAVITERRAVDVAALKRLIPATLIGIPFGVVLVTRGPKQLVIAGLGVFLIVYGIYSLVRPVLPAIGHGPWALPFGFVAGCLGSAYNIVGVPVVVYGTFRRWDPHRFRGTLQAHFLISGALVVAGQGLGGLWSTQVFALYGLSLPVIVLAVLLGAALNRRIPAGRFDQYVFVLIVLFGVLLLAGL